MVERRKEVNVKSILGAMAALGIVCALTPPASLSAATRSAASSSPSASALRKIHAFERAQYEASAPGDAYFGRLRMSYLGINNVFKDASMRAGEHTTDSDLINKLKDADEALQAWVARYPRDPQLSRSYFLAVTAYKKVWTNEYQDKAWRYMHAIVQKFPQTYFGKQVKKDLAVGFTEHYYADAAQCSPGTPSATASPAPEPTATIASKRARNAKPAPTTEPTPAPTESPSPAPVPTVKVAPGQPKVEILALPCADAASPAANPIAAPNSLLPSPGAAMPSSRPSSKPAP